MLERAYFTGKISHVWVTSSVSPIQSPIHAVTFTEVKIDPYQIDSIDEKIASSYGDVIANPRPKLSDGLTYTRH